MARPLSEFSYHIKRKPIIVKIDVEGHEYPVIEGGRIIVREASVALIEYGDRPEIVEIMNELGLKGPYYYDARGDRFQESPLPVRQDEVFLNPELFTNLENGVG